MVQHPKDHPWSSYRANGHGEQDKLLEAHSLYLQLGRTGKARQSAYRGLFRSHMDKAVLGEIRESTNKGWALGSNRFRDEVELLSRRRAKPLPKGRPKEK